MIYLIILVIVFVSLYMYSCSDRKFFLKPLFIDGYSGMSFFCGIIITFCIIGTIFGTITYFCGIGEVGRMESFYNEVCTTYEKTIEKSEEITIYAVERAEEQFSEILNTGNLAYFELAKSVNTNLQELRDEIKGYNNKLYSYRRYNANWFTDTFIPNVPEYLKPIKMK